MWQHTGLAAYVMWVLVNGRLQQLLQDLNTGCQHCAPGTAAKAILANHDHGC
jgi:hypothetical protein